MVYSNNVHVLNTVHFSTNGDQNSQQNVHEEKK